MERESLINIVKIRVAAQRGVFFFGGGAVLLDEAPTNSHPAFLLREFSKLLLEISTLKAQGKNTSLPTTLEQPILGVCDLDSP